MIAILIGVGICIIPALLNIVIMYICFKCENKGKIITFEDFVNWCEEEEVTYPCIAPILSTFTLITLVLFAITHPLYILGIKVYNSVKNKNI